jgi:NAD(P)-dependent dehydrogenase (short-subunit alcohol dehydrogenase family)
MSQLAGKRIIVVGGASGMGAASVRAYAREGAAVALLDVDREAGERLAHDTADATFVHCDVSRKDVVDASFVAAVGELGGLDVLAVAAGVWGGGPAAALAPDEFARILGVNLYGTIFANQAAFEPMRRSGGGSIINFASSAGLDGNAGAGAYSASKGGVLAWTRVIATEWGRHGIRANAVAPAIVTPMYERSKASLREDERAARDADLARRILLGDTLGDADRDFAPVMVFLASDAARFMTGQTIAVDGGLVFVR